MIAQTITTLSINGSSADTERGRLLLPASELLLASTSELGVAAIYWEVDLAGEGRPERVYAGPLRFADLGLSAYGEHRFSYYATDIHGNREAVQHATLIFGEALAPTRPLSNRPNPFQAGRETTVILFTARADGTAVLRIHDHFGGLVWSHELPTHSGETYQVAWDGRNGRGEVVGNGGYLCTVRTGGELLQRKIAVIK